MDRLLQDLGPGLAGIAATAALAWGLRRARRPGVSIDSSDVRVLRYPRVWAWLGLADMLMAAGIYVGAAVFAPEQLEQDGVVIAACLGPILLVGLVLWLEMSVTEIRISGHEIVSRTAWRPERRLAWSQIEDVRYSEQAMWYVLRGMEGTRIRVHRLLSGLPTFAEHALRLLDARVYASAAAELESDARRASPFASAAGAARG